MIARAFQQVDVFTDRACKGNPVAVVLDAQGMSDGDMQAFANWTNLSETTFVLPPTTEGKARGADYRVRIFTPAQELPFAGHPTLGTCHAWLQTLEQHDGETIVQECAAGLITIRRKGSQLAFAAPPCLRSGPLSEDDVVAIAHALNIDRQDIVSHAWCDNGPPWKGVLLRHAEQVFAAQASPALHFVGLVAPLAADHACDFEVRTFFPTGQSISEDPVTGSFNASAAQWLMEAGIAPKHYLAQQGTVLGRAGRVHIQRDEHDTIWVGGDCVTVMQGQVRI